MCEEAKSLSDLIGSDEDDPKFIIPEMENIFRIPFHLDREEAVTLSKNYILYMSAVCQESVSLGLGLSTYEACVYTLGDSLTCTTKLPAESSPLINVRFAPHNSSLLYTGCTKGLIRLWDLRTNKSVQEFKDTSNPKAKNLHDRNFCSFDVNCTGRFLCAGTEVTDGDAYLMFWDSRNASVLGGYWECHTDDVTQVSFHPSEPDQLVSGSTDGLINLYDISHAEEDDALLQSFNTESSVEKLKWHEGPNPIVSCVTHTSDLQLWHLQDSSAYLSLTRDEVATTLQMNSKKLWGTLYVAGVHSTSQTDELMVITGSNSEIACLRSAITKPAALGPQTDFEGNRQIVRCSWFEPEKEVLVTAGEAGILSIWKPGLGDDVSSPLLKATSKFKEKKQHKSKPY